MNLKKMLVSLLPWIAFSVLVHRAGPTAAGLAALLAAAIALVLLLKDLKGGVKIIDAAGIAIFGVLALVAFTGGADAATWIADYGRGGAALVIGAVMLGSAAFVPFSEQYARESVPQQYWGSPVFRATNRKISALWGAVMIVMSGCHFLAGYLDPASGASGIANILLNWLVPAALVFLGYKGTVSITAAARAGRPAQPTVPAGR
jgi:hypothetical protein